MSFDFVWVRIEGGAIMRLLAWIFSRLPLKVAWRTVRGLPAAAVALTLAACSTPQERAAQAQAEAEQMMAIYGPACIRLGYAAQSDAWRNCVISLSAKYDLQHYGPPPGYYGWGPGYMRGGWWDPYW
jgi:hypothetical protein